MRRLPHGYTNGTALDGVTVVKTYAGPDASLRAEAERTALTALAGRVPVPRVLGRGPGALTMAFVAGTHAQDLIANGHAEPVLRACGEVLRIIHDADYRHGDFGPNNLLLDPETFTVTAVLDWEFATKPLTDPVQDLAWCEWIVRMHHPEHRPALAALFRAYGTEPEWPSRHAAMLDRCRELLAFTSRWEPDGPGQRLWRSRLAATANWEP